MRALVTETSSVDGIVATCGALGVSRASYYRQRQPQVAVGPRTPSVRALSLAISQKCNLGCTYCYAQEGGFGGAPRQIRGRRRRRPSQH